MQEPGGIRACETRKVRKKSDSGAEIPEFLKQKKILSMNGGQYGLVEFSPSDSFIYIKQGIQQVQMSGYRVIMAKP